MFFKVLFLCVTLIVLPLAYDAQILQTFPMETEFCATKISSSNVTGVIQQERFCYSIVPNDTLEMLRTELRELKRHVEENLTRCDCLSLKPIAGIPGLHGREGVRGELGPIGPQGIDGLRGPPGLTGVEGSKGDRSNFYFLVEIFLNVIQATSRIPLGKTQSILWYLKRVA